MLYSFWLDIKRLIEALLGKWSLNVWMESVQGVSNTIVREAIQENALFFINGKCIATYDPPKEINAQIELYFQNANGEKEIIHLQRKFPPKRFCSEALSKFVAEQVIEFPISFLEEE